MEIDVKEIGYFVKCLLGEKAAPSNSDISSDLIGKEVIVRTYSAGVWFGTLDSKEGKEIILTNARRMWRWWCKESISLSGVVVHGINREKSQIAPAIGKVWLEAIEIMPITGAPATSIREAKDAEQS